MGGEMTQLLAETELVSAEALFEEAEKPLPDSAEAFDEDLVLEAVAVCANWVETGSPSLP